MTESWHDSGWAKDRQALPSAREGATRGDGKSLPAVSRAIAVPVKTQGATEVAPVWVRKQAPMSAHQGESRTLRAEKASAAGRIKALDLDLLAAGTGDDESHDFFALFDTLDIGPPTIPFVRMRKLPLREAFEARRRQGSERGGLLDGTALEEGFHGVAVAVEFVADFFAVLKVSTSAVDRCQEMGDGDRLIATR